MTDKNEYDPNAENGQPDIIDNHDGNTENDDTREPTEREQVIAEIQSLLVELSMVTSTSYSNENHYDTTPHQFTVIMEYHTDRKTVKTLGKVVAGLIKNITNSTIKASVEHPYRSYTDANGSKNIKDVRHIDKISVRWNERWAATPSDIRGPNGEKIDTTDVNGEGIGNVTKLAENLFALDKHFQENKKQRLEEKQSEIKCEEGEEV